VTTIAYSRRHRVMAGDRLSSVSDMVDGECTKVHKRKDGALIGVAGARHIAMSVVRWFLAGEKKASKPSFGDADDCCAVVIVRPCGKVEVHDRCGWAEQEDDYTAIGSGMDFALAALDMGADPARAVTIASRRDLYSGCGVNTVALDEPE